MVENEPELKKKKEEKIYQSKWGWILTRDAVWTTAVFVVNPANLKNSLVYRTIHALFVFEKFIIIFEVRYIFPLKKVFLPALGQQLPGNFDLGAPLQD